MSQDPPSDTPEHRRAWHAYYTEKRIVHQWLQVHLLRDLPVTRVIEIGPHLGVVTALLASAGYAVTTLDFVPRPLGQGAVGHVVADLRTLDPARLPAADAILCCETLEHIPFAEVPGILGRLAATGIPHLVLSVPFEGTQFGFSAYLNRHTARKRSFFRKFRFLKTFRPESATDPAAHQWEIGYRGYPLRRLRETVAAAGWRPLRQEFTDGCRSVFLVCRNSAV